MKRGKSPAEIGQMTRAARWAYLAERPRRETLAYLDWHFERQRGIERQVAAILGPAKEPVGAPS